MKKVKQGVVSFADPVWSKISTPAKDFIKRLLTYDPDMRPDAEHAQYDPWIQQYSKVKLDEKETITALQNLKGFRAD